MIHRTKGHKPYDERDISISGNKSNESPRNLKDTLERDGDSTTILAEDTLQGNYQSIIGRSPQIIEVLKQPETLARLQNYPWPGNVRELENALIHTVILAEGETILPPHLPEEILAFGQPRDNMPEDIYTPENQQNTPVPLGASLKVIEESFILDTLAWQNGNRTKTAKILKISIRTLQNRLKDYKISSNP